MFVEVCQLNISLDGFYQCPFVVLTFMTLSKEKKIITRNYFNTILFSAKGVNLKSSFKFLGSGDSDFRLEDALKGTSSVKRE